MKPKRAISRYLIDSKVKYYKTPLQSRIKLKGFEEFFKEKEYYNTVDIYVKDKLEEFIEIYK